MKSLNGNTVARTWKWWKDWGLWISIPCSLIALSTCAQTIHTLSSQIKFHPWMPVGTFPNLSITGTISWHPEFGSHGWTAMTIFPPATHVLMLTTGFLEPRSRSLSLLVPDGFRCYGCSRLPIRDCREFDVSWRNTKSFSATSLRFREQTMTSVQGSMTQHPLAGKTVTWNLSKHEIDKKVARTNRNQSLYWRG